MIILVDCDDTIWDLCSCWVNWLNNEYNLNVSPDDINCWDITKTFTMLEKEKIYQPLFIKEFWDSIKINPDAVKYLSKLHEENHEIFFVTSTDYNSLPYKVPIILDNFSFIDKKHIITTYRKDLIVGDVLIDDYYKNLIGNKNRMNIKLIFE